MRITPRNLSLPLVLWLCLLLMLGSGTASARQLITNTASMGYVPAVNAPAVQLQASVNVYASGASFDQARLSVQITPNNSCIVAGAMVDLYVTVTNVGLNPLTQAVVDMAAPANGRLSASSVAGRYSVLPTAGGGLSFSLAGSLPSGASTTLVAALTLANPLPVGNQIIQATLSANAINSVTVQSATFTVVGRTRSVLQFMQMNTLVNPAVLQPASVYHAGENIWLQVQDGDQNLDPYTTETVSVQLSDSTTGDRETLTLRETTPNSGVFTGMVPSVLITTATLNNGQISVSGASQLHARYTDRCDGTDTTAAASLVDPFGRVFSTNDGRPVDGAVITLIDTATGQPARVFGDDGISAYPATLTSGGSTTDAAGKVYTFPPGGYRYPFVPPGTYQFRIQPPAGFSFPTLLRDAVIQVLPGAPFALTLGSRGEVFRINPGPAMHIDIPLDAKGSTLFVRKSAASTQVTVGDFVAYNIQVENTNLNFPATAVRVMDHLPQGMQYQPGTTVIDGYAAADPIISPDGRRLQFDLYSIAAGATAKIDYVVQIGAATPLGEATNSASATGMSIGVQVGSNTALATVLVGDALMTAKTLIAGRVFIDENDNGVNEADEPGLAGVRIYMQDGTYVTTDKDGHYHFEGIVPGTHVLQLDGVDQRYTPAPLPNTRFAGNKVSQFVDAQPGALVRANFRVLHTAPPATPVRITQTLSRDAQQGVWVDLDVQQQGGVSLKKYVAVYSPPDGWQVDMNSTELDGQKHPADATIIGYVWPLTAAKQRQHIRLRLLPLEHRKDGVKESVAYVRYSAPGTPRGRTGMATATLKDVSLEEYVQRDFTLHVHFDTLKAELTDVDRQALDAIAQELQGLRVTRLQVTGHTDHVRIAPGHRHLFADNKALSEARAASIAHYLQQRLNLADDAVAAEGKADSEPVADNTTAEGRAKNRRAELHVDAVRIKRVFSVALVKTHAEASGKAVGSWDDQGANKADTPAAASPVKTQQQDGILSLKEGQGVPHRINAIRVRLDSRLKLRLSLDGKQVPNDRIGFKSLDPDTDKTLYTFIGVDLGDPGSHQLLLEGLGPFGNTRFKQQLTFVRTGEVAAIRFLEADPENIADGKKPVRIRVQLLDANGQTIEARTEVDFRGGDLLPMPRRELYQSDEEANAAVLKSVMVERDGWMRFKPTSISGTHRVDIGYNNVQRSIEVFVAPEYRDWILVALADGKLGWQQLAGHVQPVGKQVSADRYYRDGKLAFFAKGKVLGKYLLTMAYDSSKTDGANKNRLQQYINPTQYYTLYGDTTLRQSDAASKKKLYLKIERSTFYAMFGDYDTGLSITELGRYTRTMNGLKSELKEKRYGYTAFAARTSQSYIKDELRGNGTSGLYHLSRQNIITGSETLRIETRDRFQSQNILNSTQMQRFVDYDIDYQAGTLFFKSPVQSRDAGLNPIYIVVEYEANDRQDQFVNAGGRLYARPLDGLEIGSTYVQEGQLYHRNKVMAADATLELGSSTEIKAEVARSRSGATPQTVVQANAYTIKATQLGKKVSSSAYVRQMQNGFGIGQQQGSENGTRKLGGDVTYKFTDQWSLAAAASRQQNMNTGSIRDTLNNQLNWKYKEHSLAVGVNTARDILSTGQRNISRLLSASGSTMIGNRLTLRFGRDQALPGGTTSADYPTRTTAGASYMLSEKIGLDVAQEWTQGTLQNSSTMRLGLKASPWSGGQLLTQYRQSLDANGTRSFANIGMKQQWTVTDQWQVDIGLDRSQTLKHPGTTGINPTTPLASGDGNDYNAISLGINYAPEGWRWNNRLEHRVSVTTRSWSVSSGIQGKPRPALGLSWSTAATHSRNVIGTFQTSVLTSLGAAWRPDYDGLMLFDRLDVNYAASDNGVLKQLSWNYINNIHANWQYGPKQQWEFHHGIKWARQNISQRPFSGITDFVFGRWRYDISHDWDVSLQGALLHSWQDAQLLSSFGVAVGHHLMDDMWVSVGYNGHGFDSRDYAGAGYTTRGVYIDFRMKFDQTSIQRWLAVESRPRLRAARAIR